MVNVRELILATDRLTDRVARNGDGVVQLLTIAVRAAWKALVNAAPSSTVPPQQDLPLLRVPSFDSADGLKASIQ